MYLHHRVRLKGTDVYLLGKIKEGRQAIWLLSNGDKIPKQRLIHDLEGECVSCKTYHKVTLHSDFLRREVYRCFSCLNSGQNNPFYGNNHKQETKQKHSVFMKRRFVGAKNHFYGKTHTPKTRKILSDKCGRCGEENGFYGKTHSEEVKNMLSVNAKKYAAENRELMSQRAIKAMKNKKYKKTVPEKLTEAQLSMLNIPYKYNKIIPNIGQFDFIISDSIILEVHGDYWHGNPDIYGEGKRPLNEHQIYKQQRDEEKKN